MKQFKAENGEGFVSHRFLPCFPNASVFKLHKMAFDEIINIFHTSHNNNSIDKKK